jgi:hypothetical protein
MKLFLKLKNLVIFAAATPVPYFYNRMLGINGSSKKLLTE